MVRNTKERKLVWVKIAKSLDAIKYGFNSGADAGDRAILGQTEILSTDVTGLIIGCNNIKPGKATKTKATGTESSFYSYNKRAELKAAKWVCTGPKVRTRGLTRLSATHYVTINGIKYGWQSAKTGKTAPAGLDKLGIKVPKPSDTDVFFGCSFPQPPRATTLQDDGSSFSTFYDPEKGEKVPEGWRQSSSGNVAFLA